MGYLVTKNEYFPDLGNDGGKVESAVFMDPNMIV